MDRNIVYPGAIPLDTDILSIQRNTMVSLGALAAMTLGQSTTADGLACTPTSPASLTVNVGAGSIVQLSTVDQNAFGSLPASLAPLVKTGISLTSTGFALTAPTTSGQAISYLIQATLQEADIAPVVLPYYNAANPAQPYSGPNNSGVAQNTVRAQTVQLQLKAGAAAPVGTQATPPVDNGWVGLYAISVSYGQTQITAASIVTLPTGPFLQFKLPALRPGFAAMQVFPVSGTFIVPAGVTTCRLTVTGGGGGGGASTGAYSGGGGGAGGTAILTLSGMTPGQSVPVTIGAAGSAGAGSGGPGGTSSFGTYCSATGGSGGLSTTNNCAGGSGGVGIGGTLNITGGMGTDGPVSASPFAGNGGASRNGGGGRGGSGGGQTGAAPGAGGGGGYNGPGVNGGAGAAGLVIVEY